MKYDRNQPRASVARDKHGVPTHRLDDRMYMLLEVARLLESLKLSAWTHPLLIFLGRYDGIEKISNVDDSIPALFNLMKQYAARGTSIPSGDVAVDVAAFQVVYYQAAWINLQSGLPAMVWDPLAMDFREFLGLAMENMELELWKDTEPNPDGDVVRRHLLANYVRVNGFS
jgi:hypothetical protein